MLVWRVLQLLTCKSNPGTGSRYCDSLCADGTSRRCKPVLAAWLPDWPEYSDIHHLKRHVCFGASVQRTNLQVMSILTSNTPGRITTYIERVAMPTPRQPIRSTRRAMCMEDSMCLDQFPVSWLTSWSLTSSIEWRSACLTACRGGFSTAWRHTNGSTTSMPTGYPCLLTTTSHQQMSHMRKFLNGMGKRWRKWAGTCLEL